MTAKERVTAVLPFGIPAQVRAETARIKAVFGGGYIVSPSHEALLQNVSLANVIATGITTQNVKENL